VVLSAAAERQAEARSSAEAILNGAVESTIVVESFRESYFPCVQASLKDFFEELKAARPTPSSRITATTCTKTTSRSRS
jgi:hypothetical protein